MQEANGNTTFVDLKEGTLKVAISDVKLGRLAQNKTSMSRVVFVVAAQTLDTFGWRHVDGL